MSCFSCFSSDGKKASKKNGTKMQSAPPPVAVAASSRSSDLSQAPQNPASRGEITAKSSNEPTTAKRESGNGNMAAETFTFRELASATNNFRPECLIGEGGFGRVYKGRLEKTGQIVAVKQLDRNGLQGNKEFLVEVLMLCLLHHKNLVNLIGYCADGDQRLLVYELMPLGSLEDHLLGLSPDKKPLSWYTRMKIAFGAANGLEYLHDRANPPVIFRDLKSSNILLDEDFNPKLSDFGLAKLSPHGETESTSSRVMGTYGYCAPEYARTGQLTVKSDVYSFGVVMLELITGKRAIDTSRPNDEQNLVIWAQPLFRDQKRFPELVDPFLEGDYPERGLNQAVAVAAMCLQEEASVRPMTADVVLALSFLLEDAAAEASEGSSAHSSPHRSPQGEEIVLGNHYGSDFERQRAVAEAIEWGSNSRRSQMSSRHNTGSSLE